RASARGERRRGRRQRRDRRLGFPSAEREGSTHKRRQCMAAVGRTLVASRERSDAAVAVFAIVSLVWIGALLGVSFLATPVKFLAPSLTLPVALDVGRQTFHWYNRLELVFAALALASAAWRETPWRRLAARERRGASGAPSSAGIATPPYGTLLAAFLTAAVALQGAVLLPLLDARVRNAASS